MPNRLQQLVITPATSRIDEPLSIQMTGLIPGTLHRLTTHALDAELKEWVSDVVFEVQEDGSIDLERDAPLPGGSYRGVDPFGPLWSMTTPDGTGFFVKTMPTPITYTFTTTPISADGDKSSLTTIAVRHFGKNVSQNLTWEEGIAGTLIYPADAKPRPAAVILGGADGAALDHAGSLLADEGYTVLALRYFGVEDHPKHFTNIELDQIDEAISWLLEHPLTKGDQAALIGFSRGAELALQVACNNKQVGLVIAGSPAALRQPGFKTRFLNSGQPAWIRSGKPLPFNPFSRGICAWMQCLYKAILRRPIHMAPMFRQDLRDPEKVERASIPVEGCAGTVVLIAGLDDRVLPAADFCDRISRRLKEKKWSGRLKNLRMAGVGHFVCFPYALPTLPPMIRLKPASFFSVDFGGKPVHSAMAAWDVWWYILDNLETWANEQYSLG